MERLNLADAPLEGITLIEASAGTGKTYTITALYLRLVVERGLAVEQILVVTYTRAATAELRGRIRERLQQAYRVLQGGSEDDPLIRSLCQRWQDRQQALGRLRLAILDFDRAVILTIHGFCQRVLGDSAVESALPVEQELVPDRSELLQQLVDDFWRLRIQGLAPGLVQYLLDQGLDPDRLMELARPVLGRPYLESRGSPWPAGLEQTEQAYLARIDRCRELWREEADTIRRLLLESSGLKRNLYRIESLTGWLETLELWLAAEYPPAPFDRWERFTAGTLAASVRKGGEAPSHPFFDCWEEVVELGERLQQGFGQARVALLLELVGFLRQELPRRQRQRRLQSYDDLLLDLQRALQQAGGERLAASLRDRYRAALIDEFQDTDPVQYDIFRRLYHGSGQPVYLVGDPKQAIYGFRGADLYTYLAARGDADRDLTLDVNWRSVPALLDAVNTLFGRHPAPFVDPRIACPPALPAEREHPWLQDPAGSQGALRIGLLEAGEKPLSREAAARASAAATAGEIARLLGRDGADRSRLGDTPLSGGDIAVLVRSHRQGAMVARALGERGLFSVLRSRDDVFHTREAEQLQRLLAAVLEPGRDGLLRAALSTDALGFDADRLQRDGEGLEAMFDAFQGYHRQWRERGFMAMFRQLLADQEVAGRLLGLPDGERRLTNLRHLAELLHRQAREAHLGMEGLFKWLQHQRHSELPEEETHQLRLESERDLVQIVTIHRSKGLQYPVVFIPFAWDGGIRTPRAGEPYEFHDPDRDWQPVLELGSPRWEQDLCRYRNEALAESLRLLYVALTRAEQRCYLYWGRVNGAGESPLAWLLHPPADAPAGDLLAAQAAAFRPLDDTALRQRLQKLGEASGGSVVVTTLSSDAGTPEVPPPAPAGRQETLRARSPLRQLEPLQRITSFSALAHGRGDVDRPDYDAFAGVTSPAGGEGGRYDIFHFPRGARAGTALHTLFEQLDFTAPRSPRPEALVRRVLGDHGIPERWTPVVCRMLEQVLASPLDESGEVRLERVSTASRLVELGFHYPLRTLDAAGMSRLLLEQGFGRQAPLRQAVERLTFPRIQGYLKGFIDLVFRLDGRWYLADYKSNWLGGRPEDYGQERLLAVMAAEDYWLQYLFYTLALHRYLRLRLPDYDYDRHFGGVFYLFLRGMGPEVSPAGGVYRDRPRRQLIEALDHLVGAPGGAS
ncbi:MAG TPA: exodeoxyribonuclease V subunit beta [Sedimenticola thiotaurini]|uniref:RecBCD enzyme subunit RecB n=1 Tax=Sedimenticola thiotaurini TaxID=1543721 RepID=A0A831RGN6_9GAMM|nr:exodeoxyribonuclease V subunit beta [Sedimenticola thiotaurini]